MMTTIPVKTLTTAENERMLTKAFGAEFAKEAMRAERAAGVVRPEKGTSINDNSQE